MRSDAFTIPWAWFLHIIAPCGRGLAHSLHLNVTKANLYILILTHLTIGNMIMVATNLNGKLQLMGDFQRGDDDICVQDNGVHA